MKNLSLTSAGMQTYIVSSRENYLLWECIHKFYFFFFSSSNTVSSIFFPSINHSPNFCTCLFSLLANEENHVVASVGSMSAKHDPIIAGQMLGDGRRDVVGL